MASVCQVYYRTETLPCSPDCWRPETAWRDGLSPSPCPSTVLRDWMRTGFGHSTAQSRRVPKGLIHKTSSIQATAYSPGSCPREHHCQRA